MKRLLIALALLLSLGAAEQANAKPIVSRSGSSHAQGFWYGAKTPQEFSVIVAAAYARDPKGMKPMDPDKCNRDGSCASLMTIVRTIQTYDPEAGITDPSQVAGYYAKLILDCNVKGVYQMARIFVDRNGIPREDLGNMTQDLGKPGECAWVNPDTGRVIARQKCANPVGRRVDIPPCAYIDWEIRSAYETQVHYAVYGQYDDACFGYRKVSKLAEPDSPGAVWIRPKTGCIGAPCDFDAVDRLVPLPRVRTGTIMVEPGRYQWRVSRKFAKNSGARLAMCVRFEDEIGIFSSYTAGVRDIDYELVGTIPRARVFYSRSELPSGIKPGEARGLFFWDLR